MRAPPIFSGNEVVTAATIPPEGLYVNAFNVISERSTASAYAPLYLLLLDHRRQYSRVFFNAARPFTRDGRDPSKDSEAPYDSVNTIVRPGLTVNSLTVVIPSPRSGAFVRNTTMSDPATARSSSPLLVTHGVVLP